MDYNIKTKKFPIYTKICKKFSKFNFLDFISSRIENKELELAAKHLFNNYYLAPKEIISTALFFFFISIFFSLGLTLFFKSFLFIIIGIVIGYFSYNLIINKLIIEYESEKLLILQYIDPTFQEFLIILTTTRSIFDSIYFVSQGNYPYISQKFQQMIQKINHGADPEELLYEFAMNQPSVPLRERILNILATNYSHDTILEELESHVIEKENEYEKYTQQLDSKLILIIGVCSFLPLLLTIALLLNGWENDVWIFILIPIYWILVRYLKRYLLKTKFLIFGSLENESTNISNKKLEKMKLEFEELIRFLQFFGNFLKRGHSIEKSFFDAVYKYQGVLKFKLVYVLKFIFFQNSSFDFAWNKFTQSLLNNSSIQILNLIKRMLIKDSLKAGNQIISLLTQLKKNQSLITKRELVYKTQHFKIKLISLISGFILGLLMSLAPVFSLAFTFSNLDIKFQNILLKLINYLDFLPLILTLISILIISAYNLAKIIKIANPVKNILFTLIIFGSTWYISYLYLFYML
ncbi:MAG: hypothetical protein ACFFCM_16255, partial [Promethearchaeota archaeon]